MSSNLKCNVNRSISIGVDNNVYLFGKEYVYSNTYDKTKIINPPKPIFDSSTKIIMIANGPNHNVFLDSNGKVYYCGDIPGINNKYFNSPQKIKLPPIKQIDCGDEFTICLDENENLYSFGSNSQGQLGIGNTQEKEYSPQKIPYLNNVEFVVCGKYHIICKTYDDSYYSWGDNIYGQLGQGDTFPRNKPTKCLNWPDDIFIIRCGLFHTLLLSYSGCVYSCGRNSDGQLGLLEYIKKSVDIPTLINDIPNISRIECGCLHSMCIDTNNNLWVFGYNFHGQLCLGDNKNRYSPILHPTLSNIINISSGGHQTFVKISENEIYAFGRNEYAQLGIITPNNYQLNPIQVLKDNGDIWNSTTGKSRAKSARN